MEAENDFAKTEQEVREFLEQLSLAELRRLLNTPILNVDVLAYAAESELLARRIDEALNAEYRQLSADKQQELDAHAAEMAERCGVNLTDVIPPWIHRTGNQDSDSIWMTAQQEAVAGWPLVLSMDVEGIGTPVELKFDWHLSFVVVELLTSSDLQIKISIKLMDTERELQLTYGAKSILGAFEAFGLSEKSSHAQIVSALIASGLTQPKIERS